MLVLAEIARVSVRQLFVSEQEQICQQGVAQNTPQFFIVLSPSLSLSHTQTHTHKRLIKLHMNMNLTV